MTNTSPPPTTAPTAPTEPSDEQGPRTNRSEMLELGRMRRSGDRRIAGVAGGIARHLDIDPIIVRVALVVLVFFGGSGLLLYGALWLLVPEEGMPSQPLGLDDRNRNIALIGTCVLAAIAAIGDFAGAFWFPWPLVVVGLLVVWFLNRKEQRSGPYVPPAGAAPVTGYGQAPTYTPTYAPNAGPAHPEAYPDGQPSAPYQPPAFDYGHTYAKPRNLRKRGPILFWFTLALIATGIGTLGIIDVAGASVPTAAYPALALALTGAMLLLGAFWGRAGGLILLGLLLAVSTLATTALANVASEPELIAPTSSAQVRDSYDLGWGEFTVDLSDISDVEGLDGRELSIEVGAGNLEVVVPDGMDVAVDVSAGGGDLDVFGQRSEGFGVSQDGFVDGGDDVPDMRISIDLGAGQVVVREQ